MEAFLQYFKGGHFNKNSQRLIAKIFFQINTTLYVNIKNYIFTFIPDSFYFRFQGAVKVSFVYLFPFYKFIVDDSVLEIIGGKEIVIFSVLFGTTALIT